MHSCYNKYTLHSMNLYSVYVGSRPALHITQKGAHDSCEKLYVFSLVPQRSTREKTEFLPLVKEIQDLQ